MRKCQIGGSNKRFLYPSEYTHFKWKVEDGFKNIYSFVFTSELGIYLEYTYLLKWRILNFWTLHLSVKHHVFIYLESLIFMTNFGSCNLISSQS